MPEVIARVTPLRSGFTVGTNDGHDAGQLGRYRLQGDAHGHGTPSRCHALVTLGCLLTDRTPRVKARQLAETMPVDGVTTGHLVTGAPRRKQIFLAYRAVGHVLANLAVVIVEQVCVNAHATVEAMLKVFFPPNATESTFLAMVWVLFVRHPQVASVTMIVPKAYSTVPAVVRLGALTIVANATYYFPYSEAVDGVVIR